MNLPFPTSDGVSVIIPVRDGERYLPEALDSLLGQSAPPGEVVVVDDGSTDGTARILASYGDALRVVYQPPSGQFAAANRGVEASSGEVLGFLDADDLWTRDALAVRLERLLADDEPEAVFGRTVQFVSPELDEVARARFQVLSAPAHARLFQTMLIRRHAFDRVGPLATNYRTSPNIDWMSRAQAADLGAAEIDEVVALRRIHGAHVSLTESKRADLVDIVRAHR